jgi:putative peptidoglycan lipid II flippase
VREVLLNALFAGEENRKWLDCFVVAFRTPNMLRDLFAEGALSIAFVTVFTKKIKTEGDEAAWVLGRKMLTLAAVFMSVVAVLGVLLAPWIIPLLAHGWKTGSPEKVSFAVQLAQIMYPFILLVSLAALVMGMLNARKVFFMPAMASTFFNIGSMVAGGLIGWWLDPSWGRGAVVGFAIDTLVGGLLQLLVQLPSLRRVGFRFRPDFAWRDSGVKKILHLMWPAIISGSVVQVNVLLNTIFASYVDADGPVVWLNNAFRLLQLPLGLFGVGLATVSLPTLAGHATAGISPGFKNALAKNLRFVALLSLPSAVTESTAIQQWALPEVFGRLREALATRVRKPRQEWIRVLRLTESHSLEDVEAAVELAFERGSPRLATITALLRVVADEPRAVEPAAVLRADLATISVPLPDLTTYDSLTEVA